LGWRPATGDRRPKGNRLKKTLEGKVALVAGATRGAGRGIAGALGETGATVYCSGRSTRDHAATPGRTETIEETAEIVNARGGRGIAVQTDHRRPEEVKRLVDRIEREQGRLDILVNDIWGGDAWMDWWWKITRFADIPIDKGLGVIETAVTTHIITAHYAIPLMVKTKRGLIVEITDGDGYYYRGQFYYDFVKTSVIRMAMAWSYELRKQKIAAVAITPGFLRSESVLDILKVKESNWRDAIKRRPEFAESETPFYVGRAIAALAADKKVMAKSGRVFNSHELAQEYGLTDVDGRSPNIWKWMQQNMPQFNFEKYKLDDRFYAYCGVDEAMQKEIAKEVKKVAKEMAG
jgi:NAD(P)-dependent dehydrogenase (short-subunit alcohol dehydrogenase family)